MKRILEWLALLWKYALISFGVPVGKVDTNAGKMPTPPPDQDVIDRQNAVNWQDGREVSRFETRLIDLYTPNINHTRKRFPRWAKKRFNAKPLKERLPRPVVIPQQTFVTDTDLPVIERDSRGKRTRPRHADRPRRIGLPSPATA